MDVKTTIARIILVMATVGSCSSALSGDRVWIDSLLIDSTAAIAVVVNPDNPTTDLSLERLRQIYIGKVTMFEHGEPVVLCEDLGSREYFFDRVLGMSVRKVRKHWLRLVFSGESIRPPQPCKTPAELRENITKNAGAVGFIRATAVDSLMKIVTIDGRYPTDDDYPLKP